MNEAQVNLPKFLSKPIEINNIISKLSISEPLVVDVVFFWPHISHDRRAILCNATADRTIWINSNGGARELP